jgi:hypothetical protein
MHDVAILGVAAQYIRDNLAKSQGENAFVNVLDGVVHILLGGRHTTHHVTLIVHSYVSLYICAQRYE